MMILMSPKLVFKLYVCETILQNKLNELSIYCISRRLPNLWVTHKMQIMLHERIKARVGGAVNKTLTMSGSRLVRVAVLVFCPCTYLSLSGCVRVVCVQYQLLSTTDTVVGPVPVSVPPEDWAGAVTCTWAIANHRLPWCETNHIHTHKHAHSDWTNS